MAQRGQVFPLESTGGDAASVGVSVQGRRSWIAPRAARRLPNQIRR
jgi:hypothetical protein